MLFIRSFLYSIGLVVSILVLTILLFLCFFKQHYRYLIASKWSSFCSWWLKVTVNIKIDIQGLENIYKGPCVILSNHQSAWETIALQSIFPIQTFVIKKELKWIPVFGWCLSMSMPITIDRKDKLSSIKEVITQGSDRIANGISILIFPEGTRMPYNKLGKYQSGAIAIARKSKCPIQPVYHNAGKFWPKGVFIKKPGTIKIIIGKPIYDFDTEPNKLILEIENWSRGQEKKIYQKN